MSTFFRIFASASVLTMLLTLPACKGDPGQDGQDGTPGTSCTVTDNGDGTTSIACEDGTAATVTNGQDGTSCTVTDNLDGTKTLTCEDGTTATVNDGQAGTSCTITDNMDGTKTIACEDGTTTTVTDGATGLAAGESRVLVAQVTTSTPAAGGFFAAGESIVVTIELTDSDGRPVYASELSSANLYMNGPRDTLTNVTPSALLGANTDRATRPHHYVDLTDTSLAGLVITGNKLEYTLQPISTEAAGTYTVGFRSGLTGFPFSGIFEFTDIQIGTATVEPEIVSGCADCHQGATSGQMYLHHVDPGHSPTGSPDIDAMPIKSCRMCHNNDGYASVRKCTDGSKAQRINGVYTCEDGSENWTYMPDSIIRRVHGVHMGEHLLSKFNTDPGFGDFHMYEGVIFPADVKNCTKCHTDTSWKDEVSRAACGACHDNLDFTTGDYVPYKTMGSSCTADADCAAVFSGFDGKCNTTTGACELRTHTGGSATSDGTCGGCHGTGATLAPVEAVHTVPPPSFAYTVSITMDPPANAAYYVAGETPTVTIVLDDGNGPIDHAANLTDANFNRAYMYVNGPRGERVPALTSAARAEASSTVAGPWDLLDATTPPTLDLTIGFDKLSLDPDNAPAGTFTDQNAATASEVVAWLNGDKMFAALAYAVTDGTNVTLLVRPSTNVSGLTLESTGAIATTMGFTTDTMFTGATAGYYPSNTFYQHVGNPSADDPRFTWTTGSVSYKLDDVGSVPPGTYTIFVEAGSFAATPMSWAQINFQVGTATVEPKVATNCTTCHEDTRMHAGFFAVNFDPDTCGSCHDYRRQALDRTVSDPLDGWGAYAASGRGNMGFGAGPLSRRVHGVHRGKYLNAPEEVHSSVDYSEVVFPQDIRNCTVCHAESDSWMSEPSRLVCNACHDGEDAKVHTMINTYDPTPEDPWNGDEQESCKACHGEDSAFAPAEVHNIWAPYAPPYPR